MEPGLNHMQVTLLGWPGICDHVTKIRWQMEISQRAKLIYLYHFILSNFCQARGRITEQVRMKGCLCSGTSLSGHHWAKNVS